jgi:hypothetical protein
MMILMLDCKITIIDIRVDIIPPGNGTHVDRMMMMMSNGRTNMVGGYSRFKEAWPVIAVIARERLSSLATMPLQTTRGFWPSITRRDKVILGSASVR